MSEERTVEWHRKLGVALLVTVTLATSVFGFVLVRKRINDPLKPNANITFKSDEQLEAERVAAQKAADTDGDTLSDYDELYIYRTSPFLKDSDSDDLDDGVEIAQNLDPNCRKGTQCRQTAAPATNTTAGVTPPVGAGISGSGAATGTATNGAVKDPSLQAYETFLQSFGDPSKLTATQIDAKVDAMSSTQLHGFLKSLGLSEADIAKHDDAWIKVQLKDTLRSISSGAAGTNANSNTNP